MNYDTMKMEVGDLSKDLGATSVDVIKNTNNGAIQTVRDSEILKQK